MNTLKEFYLGESGDKRETWGYVKNGITVRLGSKHYAEELCKKYKVDCVRLNDLTDDEQQDQDRSDGQEDSMLGEATNTFAHFLITHC